MKGLTLPDDFDPADFLRPSPGQVTRWLIAAKPGARLVYGYGVTVSEAADAQVAQWLWQQAQKGFVALHQRRIAKGGRRPFEYLAVRLEKRWDPDAPGPASPEPKARLNVVRQSADRAWAAALQSGFAA